MKKIISLMIVGILVLSFVLAQQGQNVMSGQDNSENSDDDSVGSSENQNREGNEFGETERVEAQINTNSQNKKEIRVGEYVAECDCELVQNGSKVMAKLSNGKNAEVKVMPDTASEKALEMLRLRVCSSENNCTIELKEVGSGEKTQLAYELQTQRKAKFLGLFGTEMQVKAQVSAENGEVISVNKPWWAFLASEPEETSE